MLLRHRAPGIDSRPITPAKGFEHLDPNSIAMLRWLGANRVEFVLVGSVAAAIRGDSTARGPVAIVAAPYNRNYERLARALTREHARMRIDRSKPREQENETMPVKLTAEKLARGLRWTLRCGEYDVDIEGHPGGVQRYQELLYEATRFELGEDVAAEIASPEDIEHYAHVRRTGTAPEIRITRTAGVEQDTPTS
jgi:hypothetical protein